MSLDLLVTRIDDSVPQVRSLRLEAADATPLPAYTPGSHLVIDVPLGGGRPRANAYSLTGDSVRPAAYEISVLRCDPASGGHGGSAWVHGLQVGDRVSATLPRSAFAPIQRATKHLLLGAGIGITPLLSHLRSHVRWGRDAELVYLFRDGHGAHVAELTEIAGHGAGNTANTCVTFVHDRAAFTALLADLLLDQPIGTHLYTCGPAGFMDAVTAAARDLGWPPSRIHFEPFGIDALDPGDPFTVALGETTIEVPSGVSLLEALEGAGRAVPNLCRQGVCGECRVSVTASTGVLHRDLYLSDDDKAGGACLMACVSRAMRSADGTAHLEVTL